MKRIYLSLYFIFMTFILHAQTTTFEWAKSMGGYYGLATGVDVAVDNSNNVYTTGHFEGRVDFDPGSGVYNLTTSTYGDQDIFICKYNNAGNLIWAKQIVGTGTQYVTALAADGSGNVYVTGFFYSADFDPDTSVYTLSSFGGYDSFILKLDNSGNFVWARQIGNHWSGYEYAYSIAVDATGNVYTTGRFQGTSDFDPGPGIFNLTTGGNREIFVSKLDASANFVWAKQFEGNNNNQGNSIAVDGSGNVYTTGYFKDTVDFDPGPGVLNFVSPGWVEDIFVSKLDASGNLVWARQLGGSKEDIATSIAVDATGNVYTTGHYSSTADFDPGSGIYNLTASTYRDIFISKLNASGNFVWVKSQGGTGDDRGHSIAVDGSGSIYTTGYFWGIGDFDPGPGTLNFTTNAGNDIFVSKINTSGNLVWAKQMGGTNNEEGNSIAVDGSGNVLTTGYFSGNTDFDPGAAIANLPALGNCAFISKLSSVGNYVWAKGFGKNAAVYSKSITTDLAGNVFTTGYFYGTVDFDPGPGVFNLITTAPDAMPDIFISKTDPSGNLVWAKQISGASNDYSNGITTDVAGNVFITGSFNGTVDFDPGPGVFNLTAVGYTEAFVAKLNTSGNLVWAKQTTAGTSSSAEAIAIAVDASGNIITTGRVYNTVDFDPGTATFNLVSSNSTGIFIWKLDNSGNFIWAKQMGGPSSFDEAHSIAVDATGNVYSTGNFTATADFDPGSATYYMIPNGQYDIYISKLDSSGNFVWARQIGGAYSEEANSITTDVAGNVYATGHFASNVDFDPGPGTYFLNSTDNADIFILKINSSGNFVWAKQFTGGSGNDKSNSIISDASGNIYTTGNFLGPIDFDPDAGTYTLGSYSFGDDVFILKLDTSGHFVWANILGYNPANINTFETDQFGNGITIDQSGNVYTTGNVYGAADFDPDTGAFYISSIGNPDMFIHKLSQCPWANITPAGATIFCNVGNVLLNANTGAGLSYQWKKNGTNIPGATTASYVATTAGNYKVAVSGPCGTATSPTITVTINPLPSAMITPGGPTTFCSGNSVILSAPTGVNYSYQWKKNGANISGAVNSNYTATASGTYKVTVTNTNTGCSKTTKTGIVVTVNALPAALITPSGTISFCQGQSALLSANSGTGYTYQWSRNNISISGATSQTYTVTDAGKYRVAVTNLNGCTRSSLPDTVLVPCTVNDTDDARFGKWIHDVSIFPNPNFGEFTIQFSDKPNDPVTIELTDAIGNVIQKFRITSNTAEIKTPNLSNGIYYLKIWNNHIALVRKINILK